MGAETFTAAAGCATGVSYFTYVFPCVWEDHCKVGFSRDPLSRLQALHRRWFEFFDLDRIVLVASDSEREARDLELALRRPLKVHKAPMPLTVSRRAGGHTEWLRGSYELLEESIQFLHRSGYQVESQPRTWLRSALMARSDRLFSWSSRLFSDGNEQTLAQSDSAAASVLDTLDAYTALGLDVAPCVTPEAYRWYRSYSVLPMLAGDGERSGDDAPKPGACG